MQGKLQGEQRVPPQVSRSSLAAAESRAVLCQVPEKQVQELCLPRTAGQGEPETRPLPAKSTGAEAEADE